MRKDLPPLLTAYVSYGIELGFHLDAPTEKTDFSSGTTQCWPLDTSPFQLEDKFLSHLTLLILQEPRIIQLNSPQKTGQQLFSMMSFFQTKADFQKNFLQF